MYYSFEVIPAPITGYKHNGQAVYVHSFKIDPSSGAVLEYTLTNTYLLSWMKLSIVEFNALHAFITGSGFFEQMYEYYGCINPDRDELERIYGMIPRFANVTAIHEKPRGYVVNLVQEGIELPQSI